MIKVRAKPTKLSKFEDFSITPPRPYDADEIRLSVRVFLEENLYGAYTLDLGEAQKHHVLLSLELFAFFLREIFAAVYGKARVGLVFGRTDDLMSLRITFPREALCDADYFNIAKAGVQGGLSISAERDGYLVLFREVPMTDLRIYASSDYPTFETLHWIFFHRKYGKSAYTLQ